MHVGADGPNGGNDSLSEIESKKHRMHTGQDSEAFSRRYQLLEQLGSGASGTVWKCRLAPGCGRRGPVPAGEELDEPVQGVVYAAKIIDLRSFKLRERFSMQRLMREVNIMQRLQHPNIIRLVEAIESPDQLVLVLEYAQGVELFDAILSKTGFSEAEARPVFVQVARALRYMHLMQIVHRDVKPENVMIMNRPTRESLFPEVKLLDFGLSKAMDTDMGGSVARTFVGTPSYLAPEVEEKPGGRGKPYGTPVDCWSLGAMLYVMLVARFPEFQVQGKRKFVRMHGPLWDKISPEVRELIQRLMAFNPGARMTIDQALRHPWLGEMAEKDPAPPSAPPSPKIIPQSSKPTPQQTPGRHSDSSDVSQMTTVPEDMAFSIRAPVPPAAPPPVPASAPSPGPSAPGTSVPVSPAPIASAPPVTGSPGQREANRGGAGEGGVWGTGAGWDGRPPIVTEQETPPPVKGKKSFEFSPPGPTIRELNSDESPLSSFDSGMGDKVETEGHQPDGRSDEKVDRMQVDAMNMDAPRADHARGGHGKTGPNQQANMREQQTAMVALYGAQGVGLAMPPDGGVPLLQAASSLRRSANLCRESLRESVTLLRKIERTASQVLTLFPDLTLAVEEGEPELAHDFFSTVKGWVREMYTAVSLVQAKNSANAKEVSEAMERHAKMGLHARERKLHLAQRHQQQQQQKQQQQQQQQQQEQRERNSVHSNNRSANWRAGVAAGEDAAAHGGAVGGERVAYVAKGPGTSARLSGQLEVDADRQGDLIAVDPETFELVRQIKALRQQISADSGETSRAADGGAGGNGGGVEGNVAGGRGASSPVEAISDEKLISLFLLVARGSERLASGRGAASGPPASVTDAPGVGAAAAPAAAAGGGGGSEGVGRDGGGVLSGRRDSGDGGSGQSAVERTGAGVLGGVEAMFASPGMATSAGMPSASEPLAADGRRGARVEAAATAAARSADEDVIAGLTSQMSVDEAGIPAAAMAWSEPKRTSRSPGSDGIRSDGKAAREEVRDSHLWDKSEENALQLSRLDGDKVYTEVQRALQMLLEVDKVLEQLALFWANSEVIFDVLLRKGDLVEKFVAFANKPRLLQRFRERLADYRRFWQGVQGVCNKYVCGQLNCTDCDDDSGGGAADGSGAPYFPAGRPASSAGQGSFDTANSASGNSAHGVGLGVRSDSDSPRTKGVHMASGEGFAGAGGWDDVGMGLGMPENPGSGAPQHHGRGR